MEKQTKQKKPTITKAEKKDAVKALFRELLKVKPYKRTALIDETAALYTQRFPDKDTENVNDVKGRVGSVFDIMKKDGEIVLDGGMYALNAQKQQPAPEVSVQEPKEIEEKKTVKKTASKTKAAKTEKVEKQETAGKEEKTEGKRAMKKAVAKKGEKKKDEQPVLPIIPINPNYPVDPIAPAFMPIPLETPKTDEKEEKEKAQVKRGRKPKAKVAQVETVQAQAQEIAQVIEQAAEQVPAPKKRGRKPKAAAVKEEQPIAEKAAQALAEVKDEKVEKAERVEDTLEAVKEKAEEVAKQTAEETPAQEIVQPIKAQSRAGEKTSAPVFDMTLLLGNKKEEKKQQEPAPQQKTATQEKTEKIEKQPTMSATKEQITATEKVNKQEQLPKKAVETAVKGEKQTTAKEKAQTPVTQKKTVRGAQQSRGQQSADEILKEKFLKRLRSLGGDYFEYYSVYLLERYSMKNGRRLESLRICGGERDGGIDGEIELTDKLGFRETIYIQAKNWNPDKGDEKYWVVGETLLQQFLGACVCRQAKDGKQHCRGIFMTTSRFTPEGKRLLEQMSDRLVGYDGSDLYEAAKECSFGLVQKNGEWTLDEKLLSGERAFFSLY